MKKAFLLCLAILLATSVSSKKLRFLADVGAIGKIDLIAGAVGKVCGMWQDICGAFSTKFSSYIKSTELGKGFDYFYGSASISVTAGIRNDTAYETYSSRLVKRLKVPSEQQEAIADILADAQLADSQAWTSFDMLFDVDSKEKDKVKYASVLVNYNEKTGKYDAIATDLKADFTLAPDVTIIHESKSYVGGIFSKEKEYEVKKPKKLDEDQLQAIFQFFQIVSMKVLANIFGYKLQFPKL